MLETLTARPCKAFLSMRSVQDRDLEMCMCVFVSVCEEMPFGSFCEDTSTTLDSLPFSLENSSRWKGWLSSIQRAKCLSLSLLIFPSHLPCCLCSLLSFASPSFQDGTFRRLRSSWNNVHLSSAVSRPGRSQVQEDLGISSKPLPKR